MDKKTLSIAPAEPKNHALTVVDIATFLMCLIYATAEFSLIGRSSLVILRGKIDRCVLMGLFFLVAAAGVFLFVRVFTDRRGFIAAWFRVFYCMFYFGMFFLRIDPVITLHL